MVGARLEETVPVGDSAKPEQTNLRLPVEWRVPSWRTSFGKASANLR
jgi:hypothetical protein